MRFVNRQRSADFVVIGGGIVGLAIARELRHRHAAASIVVLEKESHCGLHASGRNSGVIHAGFYYSADSLKAALTRDGNRLLTEYCFERGLSLNRCGKVVVASGPQDLPGLDELERRAKLNGVDLKSIDVRELNELEPRAATCERALFSPTTSSVDPKEVVGAVVQDVKAQGVEVRTEACYTGRTGSRIETPD
jgi:L-2-hydroxyglutarate oxidase LhgO